MEHSSVVSQDCDKVKPAMKIKRHTAKAYHLDLGDSQYSVLIDGVPVQVRTLIKIKCKGGMRDCFIPPEGYLWVSCDYCISLDTNIITKRGNVRAGDLIDGDEVLTPWGFRVCHRPHNTGKKKIVKIKLKSGETLRCSADHPICVKRNGKVKWITAGSLISTDYLFSINNTNYLHNHGIDCNNITKD